MPKDFGRTSTPIEQPARSPLPSRGGLELQGRPTTSAEGTGEFRKPRMKIEPRFWLAVHPKDWSIVEIDGKLIWAPEVRKIPIIGGVNGVRQTPTGLNTSHARTKMRDNGWIFVPENPPYLREIDAHGGVTYVDVWTRVRAYPDGSVEVKRDTEAFDRWRVSLVEKGLIDPIRPSVIRRHERLAEKRVGRHIDQIHIPSRKIVVERAEAEADRIAKAVAPEIEELSRSHVVEMEAASVAVEAARADADAARAETARLRAELALMREQQVNDDRDGDDD